MALRSHPGRWFAYCAMALMAPLWACKAPPAGTPDLGGDAERGRALLARYGCGNCHVIPGVVRASGTFGPPLENVGKRVYLAGALPNSPANLAAWIRAPQAIKPGTAMLDLHVTETDARDMVAYLDRLR